MRRTPSLFWPIVCISGGMLVLLGLGTWQVERLFWKEGLIAQRQAAVTAPPAALPDSLAAARGLEYHHVSVAGTFLPDHELYLGATDDDGHLGYHVIEPLRLASGAVLLVDRGYVPEELKLPATRAAGEPQGEVTVTGLLRLAPPEKPHWFLPDNSAARNYWFWVDIPAMAAAPGSTACCRSMSMPMPRQIPAAGRAAGRRGSICPTTICNMPSPGTRWRRSSPS